MKVQICKDSFGWKYRTELWSAWTYFENGITNKKKMLDFFTEEGRLNITPDFEYVNNEGKPSIHYKIKRGNNYAVCNGDDSQRVMWQDRDFMFLKEQIDYLALKTDEEINADAEKFTKTDFEKLDYLKRNASPETLKGLDELITFKITDDSIKLHCQNHAKQYYNNSESMVEFEN